MFPRSLYGFFQRSWSARGTSNAHRPRRQFQPETPELEPRIALADESHTAYEIAYLGDLGSSYSGPILVYLSGGSNPIDSQEWASYSPPPGYIKNSPRNLQFNAQTFLSSPDSSTFDYITTSDGYTWEYIAKTVSSNWPFNPDDYPDEDYTSGYEAAALEVTPPPGVIKWTDNTKNQEVTYYADNSDGQPIQRYFLTDPWGNTFIMQASGVTDASQIESNFLSAVLPPGWKKSIGYLKQNLTTLPAYNNYGSANYNLIRDSADDSFQQISWGKRGWGTAQMIAGMPIWGGTDSGNIGTNPSHDNVVYAAGGNDRIFVHGLINTIYGDGDDDKAFFQGQRSQYTVTVVSADTPEIVVARRGSQSATHVTTLYDVEHIMFNRRCFTLTGERLTLDRKRPNR